MEFKVLTTLVAANGSGAGSKVKGSNVQGLKVTELKVKSVRREVAAAARKAKAVRYAYAAVREEGPEAQEVEAEREWDQAFDRELELIAVRQAIAQGRSIGDRTLDVVATRLLDRLTGSHTIRPTGDSPE